MTKTEINFTQQDRELFEKIEKNSKIQLIIGCVIVPVFILPVSMPFFIDCSIGDKIILFFLTGIIAAVISFGFYRTYLIHKSIITILRKGKKIVLEAETESIYYKTESNAIKFFKNDDSFYKFNRLNFAFSGNYLKKITHFTNNANIVLQYVDTNNYVFNYQIIENQVQSKGYQTQIVSITKEDKKILLDTFIVILKIFNFVILPLFAIILSTTIEWEINETSKLIIGIFLSIFVALNLIFLIWYAILKRNLQNPNKIVYTGKITDLVLVSRKYSNSLVFFGLDSFNVNGTGEIDIAPINSIVALHYLQKSNGKRGNLIKLEKL